MTATTLRLHDGEIAVCRFEPHTGTPAWASPSGPLHAILHSANETTVVCAAGLVPAGVRHEGPFRALEVQGPLDFSLTGVLAGLLAPLAEAAVSVLTMSTFDTDWILVPAGEAPAASRALTAAGYPVAAVPGAQEATA